jgi:hypothetical protein
LQGLAKKVELLIEHKILHRAAKYRQSG